MTVNSSLYNTDLELLQLINEVKNWGRWGPDDQIGTLNYISEENILKAKELIKTGKTITLSHESKISPKEVHEGIKVEEYRLMHDSDVGYCSDFVGLVCHGLKFTHLDGLSHVFTKQEKVYNGYSIDVLEIDGAKKLGIEHMASRGIVARGVLFDIPLIKARNLESNEIIYLEDLLKFQEKIGIKVGRGDILFIRSGSQNTIESMAGLHPQCIKWFHELEISLLGSDGGSDYYPNKSKEFLLPIHEIAIPYMGMPLIDNAKLDKLSEYCKQINRYEFFVSIAPWNISGSTGSLVNPIAIF